MNRLHYRLCTMFCTAAALTGVLAASFGTASAALIVHYTLDEDGPNIVDQVGGQTATAVDAGHIYGAPSPLGRAVGLNANGSWQLTVEDSAEMRNLTNNFSVATWVKLDSEVVDGKSGLNAAFNRIIGDDVAWDADGWAIGWVTDGRLRFTKNGIIDADLPFEVPLDAWTHFAATVSSTTGVTFYINGENVGNIADTRDIVPAPGNNGMEDLYGIGRTYGALEEQWFGGFIDDVRVFDEVLSAGAVVDLFDEVFPEVDGDVDRNGIVEVADFAIIRDNFLTGFTPPEGDLNVDGRVDFADFRLWKKAFDAAGAVAAPEPSSLLLASLGFAAIAVVGRRAVRRREQRVDE